MEYALPSWLEAASKVLQPETIEILLTRMPPARELRPWKIAERWAVQRPNRLRLLEKDGLLILHKLQEQKRIEERALESAAGMAYMRMGMTEFEIFQRLEIETDLVKATLNGQIGLGAERHIYPRTILDLDPDIFNETFI